MPDTREKPVVSAVGGLVGRLRSGLLDDLPGDLAIQRPEIGVVQLLNTAAERNPAFAAAFDVDVIEVSDRVSLGAGRLRVAPDRCQVMQVALDSLLDFAAQDHFAVSLDD